MTVFEKILTHLFLITNPALQALALYEPLDSSWCGGGGWGATVLEAQAYCVPLSTGWGLKPPFYFFQALSPYLFIQLRWTEKAKILASNTCMLFLSDPPHILLSITVKNSAGVLLSLQHLFFKMFTGGQSDECECLAHWTFDLHFSSRYEEEKLKFLHNLLLFLPL